MERRWRRPNPAQSAPSGGTNPQGAGEKESGRGTPNASCPREGWPEEGKVGLDKGHQPGRCRVRIVRDRCT